MRMAHVLCVLIFPRFCLISDQQLLRLERIHLDGEALSCIDDCFDLMSHGLTHLYLQRNFLESTQGFAVLKNLRFLMLAQNRIRMLEGLAGLSRLEFLDVSDNLIDELDTGDADVEEDTCQLPERLVHLNVRGNPFAENPEVQEHIVTVSPYLKVSAGKRGTGPL
jgi:Leucine-rich repeat (LRR) protein